MRWEGGDKVYCRNSKYENHEEGIPERDSGLDGKSFMPFLHGLFLPQRVPGSPDGVDEFFLKGIVQLFLRYRI